MKPFQGLARITGFSAVMVMAGWVLWWAARAPVTEITHAFRDGHEPAAGWSFDRLLTDAVCCLTLLVFAALCASATLTVLTGLLGGLLPGVRRVSAALTPTLWRRCVLAACGLGVAAPGLLPVSASADGGGHSASCQNACEVHVAGLALPDLPAPRDLVDDQLPRSAHTTVIVVAPGDSLWSIAARQLAPTAGDDAIAARVHALYSLNRHVVGPDPDLIFPGMHITTPEGSS